MSKQELHHLPGEIVYEPFRIKHNLPQGDITFMFNREVLYSSTKPNPLEGPKINRGLRTVAKNRIWDKYRTTNPKSRTLLMTRASMVISEYSKEAQNAPQLLSAKNRGKPNGI